MSLFATEGRHPGTFEATDFDEMIESLDKTHAFLTSIDRP